MDAARTKALFMAASGLLLGALAVCGVWGTWQLSEARNEITAHMDLVAGVDQLLDVKVDQPGAYEVAIYPAGGAASLPDIDYELSDVTPPLASRVTSHDVEFARTSDGRGVILGWFAPGPHRVMSPWTGHSLRLRNEASFGTLPVDVVVRLTGGATHRPAIASAVLPFIAVLASMLSAGAALLLRAARRRLRRHRVDAPKP